MDEQGLIVARFRRHVVVEDDSEQRVMSVTAKRSLKPLVGDRVVWQRQADDSGVITSVLPRQMTFTRIDSRGRREAVAANLSQIMVVAAPRPSPDWFLLDRYLVACELLETKAVLVFNKQDQMTAQPDLLAYYRNIGYPVFFTSAKEFTGLEALTGIMANERSVMVGQSGVGKSSLLNALLGEQLQSVGELTEKGKQGRHTTTTVTLFRLANGAELIDSPGVRNYAPYIENRGELQHGFREFKEYMGRCRFDNCRHLAEPACAVKTAVENNQIDTRRYESYQKLGELLESLRIDH